MPSNTTKQFRVNYRRVRHTVDSNYRLSLCSNTSDVEKSHNAHYPTTLDTRLPISIFFIVHRTFIWMIKFHNVPYILECNPQPFNSFRGLKNQFIIYCPSYTTQWCKVKIMQQLTKLHVSTPWGHLQVYKIWYHTRYNCCYYLREPIGSNNRCTLYDTILYKPEDDPMESKHVALLIIA